MCMHVQFVSISVAPEVLPLYLMACLIVWMLVMLSHISVVRCSGEREREISLSCWVLDYQEDPFPSLGGDPGAGAGPRGAE